MSSPKKYVRKNLIFGQKPWTIPFGKCQCFALFKSSIFWSKKPFCSIHKIKNNLYKLLFSQKKGEKVWFLDKKYGLSPLENLAVLHFWKLYIAGLKIVLFYPEYQKTIFSDLISPKNTNRKYFDFWPKKWIISLEKTIFADLLKL